MQAIHPQVIRFRDDGSAMRKLYLKMFYVITLTTTIGLSVYGFFGQFLLDFWLKDSLVANHVYPLLGMLLIGATLSAFYNMGYAHWMAMGRTARILQVNLLTLFLCLLIVPSSIERFGTIGATVGWLIINLVGLAMSLPGVLSTLHKNKSRNIVRTRQ